MNLKYEIKDKTVDSFSKNNNENTITINVKFLLITTVQPFYKTVANTLT